ncbi:chaperonin 10-like protein [Phascolomyces articulosus]|uniref:L-arabinitol 4-dehydrogenase n=1 Tax=Phascolomyces articulosus TaxID=60185 RepID=A0AAD5KSW4_9FUNG|nr:chaperonin 10-like protein [Phascolomyces articulosus]
MGLTVYQPDYELPQSNQGAALTSFAGSSNLQIVPLDIPTPRNGEALIQMKATSISSLDIVQWKLGLPSYSWLQQFILGHEGAGIVTAVDNYANPQNIQVGDRVAIEPSVPCSDCNFCLDGRYNLCSNIIHRGTFPLHGLFAKYVTHPTAWLHRIPNHISYSEAALLDPLCIAIAAIDRSGVRISESLLVTGTSPIALLVLMVAKATGIGPVIVLDTHPGRLTLAESLGADSTYYLDPKWSEETVAQAICGEFINGNGEEGAQSSIECTGTAPALRIAIMVTRQGGVCCRTEPGGDADQVVPISTFALRDITLRGVHK